MTARVVPAELSHVMAICSNLRERELRGFDQLNEPPEKVITRELARSVLSFTGMVDEKIVVLFGAQVSTMLSDSAYVWIVCSKELEYFPMTFLRHSRQSLSLLKENFREAYGYVVSDFDCSIRWLKWLGFSLRPAEQGVHYFYKVL